MTKEQMAKLEELISRDPKSFYEALPRKWQIELDRRSLEILRKRATT